MTSHNQDDFDLAFAEKAALLVWRMIEVGDAGSRCECHMWAMQSRRHLHEVIETLRMLGALDELRVLSTVVRRASIAARHHGEYDNFVTK